MSNPKIIIEVKGGTVVAVLSSQDIDIVIVDYDNVQNGSPAWNGDILGQDALFDDGEAHDLFTDATDPMEMELRDELKRKHF